MDRKKNFILFEDDLKEELRDENDKQLNRILYSENSEDLITWNTFSVLGSERITDKWEWILELLQMSLGKNFYKNKFDKDDLNKAEIFLWKGRRKREFYPPPEHDKWLKEKLTSEHFEKLKERLKKNQRLEGPSEIDVVIETNKLLIFIEAKYLEDISIKTTRDLTRDQITRNIDVGTFQAIDDGKEFYFILLTLDKYPRQRLFWYKMMDYKNPSLLKKAIPYRAIGKYRISFRKTSRNIGWITWSNLKRIVMKVIQDNSILEKSTIYKLDKFYNQRGII